MDLSVKIRQLAQLEYRANNDVATATKNICQIFGYHSVDLITVQRWFNVFKYQKISKFNSTDEHEIELAEHLPNDKQFLNGMLSQIKIEDVRIKLNTFDGRIAYGISDDNFIVVDMFHGKYKLLPFPFGINELDTIEFVDETRFLALDYEDAVLHLYKFNFDAFAVDRLDSVHLDRRLHGGYLSVDKSDPTKVMIHQADAFCFGQAIENRIEVGEVDQLGIAIMWPCLNESKFRFIRPASSSSCKLYEWILGSSELRSAKIRTKFNSGKAFDLADLDEFYEIFAWSEQYFYIAYETEDRCWKVAVLDTNIRKWFDTGIKVWGSVRKMFVDQDMFLTVITKQSSTFSFYRFPLKKPDSLMNLAWFAYTSTFKKTNKRGKLFKHLPYTCHLRLELPGVK